MTSIEAILRQFGHALILKEQRGLGHGVLAPAAGAADVSAHIRLPGLNLSPALTRQRN
jgi:hypothetical protein